MQSEGDGQWHRGEVSNNNLTSIIKVNNRHKEEPVHPHQTDNSAAISKPITSSLLTPQDSPKMSKLAEQEQDVRTTPHLKIITIDEEQKLRLKKESQNANRSFVMRLTTEQRRTESLRPPKDDQADGVIGQLMTTPQAVRAPINFNNAIMPKAGSPDVKRHHVSHLDDSMRCQTQLASRSPNGGSQEDASPLIPNRDGAQGKMIKLKKAHHTMDAEEPFTSEFSRWIQGGIKVAGTRSKRNEPAAQVNSCGQHINNRWQGHHETSSDCQQSPFLMKKVANVTPHANTSCRRSIDSGYHQNRLDAINENGSPVRHWQQAAHGSGFVTRMRASPLTNSPRLRRGQVSSMPADRHGSSIDHTDDIVQNKPQALRASLNISRNSQADMESHTFDRRQNDQALSSSPEKRSSIERLTIGQKNQFAKINGQIILNFNGMGRANVNQTSQIDQAGFELPPVIGASLAADKTAVRRVAADRCQRATQRQENV